MHNKYANNDKIRQQRAEKICNNIEIFYERKKCMVAIFTLQLQLHPAIISPSPDIPKNMQCSLHIYEYRCERYVPFRILWRSKAPCFFMFWLSLNARHLKRFKSTFIRHFLKYHGLSSQQLTANSRRILLFEGLILGPEFKLPPTNLGCFQLSLEPLQRQLHLLQDGTGDNAEGIGQTHSNIDLSSCSHAFPICPRSNFYFLRPPLSCFFPSAPLSANNKNFYKMASG